MYDEKDEQAGVDWQPAGKEYRIVRLLGHGKGGYSYLAEAAGMQVVVKQIHHEPCDYYTFGNKIEAEKRDYQRLRNAGIRIPTLIAIDEQNEIVVKEYIAGDTIFDMVREGISGEPYLDQVREMALQARNANLNIDFFPTNFVVRDGISGMWIMNATDTWKNGASKTGESGTGPGRLSFWNI